MTRRIDQLEWAQECPRPKAIPIGRPRGAKAAGVRYEKAVARALPQAKHGQWFEYSDHNGSGWCQPDLLLDLPNGVLVLEVKYTWTAAAYVQLEGLYLPVVGKARSKPCRGMMVCRNLVDSGQMAGVYVTGDFVRACTVAASGGRVALQWLGKSPLWTPAAIPAPSHRAPVATPARMA